MIELSEADQRGSRASDTSARADTAEIVAGICV
jgi:hypothetical protein